MSKPCKPRFTAADFPPHPYEPSPTGKPCPTCKQREGDNNLLGDCRVCAAVFFNKIADEDEPHV